MLDDEEKVLMDRSVALVFADSFALLSSRSFWYFCWQKLNWRGSFCVLWSSGSSVGTTDRRLVNARVSVLSLIFARAEGLARPCTTAE